MFTKTRQLVYMTNGNGVGEDCWIRVPGYLFRYEPFLTEFFVHRAVMRRDTLNADRGFYLASFWRVSDISTGMGVFTTRRETSRKKTVERVCADLSTVSLQRYNEVVWEKLQECTPHVASWEFTRTNLPARRVQSGQG